MDSTFSNFHFVIFFFFILLSRMFAFVRVCVSRGLFALDIVVCQMSIEHILRHKLWHSMFLLLFYIFCSSILRRFIHSVFIYKSMNLVHHTGNWDTKPKREQIYFSRDDIMNNFLYQQKESEMTAFNFHNQIEVFFE